jgi:ferredoxin
VSRETEPVRVTIDEDGCRGHGICTTICPEVFLLNDDGYSEVISPDVPAELEDAVRRAVASCPERAITAG